LNIFVRATAVKHHLTQADHRPRNGEARRSGASATLSTRRSLSPGLQHYLEGMCAVHSAVVQQRNPSVAVVSLSRRCTRSYVCTEQCLHQSLCALTLLASLSTHSIYLYVIQVLRGRIVDVPKAESDTIHALPFFFFQISQNYDFQVRFKLVAPERRCDLGYNRKFVALSFTGTFPFHFVLRKNYLRVIYI
jgi:hypothetical protein